MATDETRVKDMDSLFEGMVLFNPSQVEADLQSDNQQDNCSDEYLRCRYDALTTSATASSSCSQQPLDENLFSDLTVVVAPLQNLKVAEAEHDLQSQSCQFPSIGASASIAVAAAAAADTATTSSRQTSRRRKRAGLRIGYGRDTLFSNDLHHPPPFSDNPTSDSETRTVFKNVKPLSANYIGDTLGDTLPTQPPSMTVDATVSQPSGERCLPEDSSNLEKRENENRKEEDISMKDYASNDTFSEADFRQIKARIYEKLNQARQLVNSASAVRKDSIRNRRKAVENANLAALKYMELEKQLEEVCEAEDFERAEKVSENLSAAEKEKQTFSNSVREADAFTDALDLKMQQALNSLIAAEEECAILLEHYATNAANNAEFSLKKTTSVHSKEMDKLLSSSEALEIKRMKLEIESHFLSQAHLELNNTIEHSIQDDKREKEILCKRKDMLMDELEKLLALVKQKEKEIADNDSNLKAVENKICNVISGFKDIQSSIDVKYDKLQSILSQVKLQAETLALKKEEIDKLLIQEEEMGVKLKDLARTSEEEAKGYWELVELRKRLMSSILKSREDKLTLANNEEKLSGDVKMFQQEVSAARVSLQELSSRKSSIRQDISSFKQRIIFIDKRILELEAEKKVATASRNFKEAARMATDAKSLCVEKEGIKIDIDTATSNLEKLEEEIKETLDKLQVTEEMIVSKEKELAMARYQRLLLTAATARAEKTAALDMGDVEEANLLLAEAESADCEAEKLKSTYNFKMEDFTNLQKDVVSMDLVSYLGRERLAELAVSLHPL